MPRKLNKNLSQRLTAAAATYGVSSSTLLDIAVASFLRVGYDPHTGCIATPEDEDGLRGMEPPKALQDDDKQACWRTAPPTEAENLLIALLHGGCSHTTARTLAARWGLLNAPSVYFAFRTTYHNADTPEADIAAMTSLY